MLKIYFLILIVVLVGCRHSHTPTITLKIEDDFTGVVIIRWTQSHGVHLARDRDSYILEIPASGLLEVQGDNLMTNWFIQRAVYKSGEKLVHGTQHTTDEDGIYLWDMGVNADGTEIWYVVGRIKDLKGVRARKFGVQPF